MRPRLLYLLHTVIVSLRCVTGMENEPRCTQRTPATFVCNLHAHLVFVTKYRQGVFTNEMPARCEEIMREVCADFEVELR
ncbi:transposase [Sphaerisporangium sp. NPDC051011]|uniref:transposase n=1 Tax=Sphaerisporangium sp. NPDC051011 TaxID=3155792 RepID=UPI0033FB0DF7